MFVWNTWTYTGQPREDWPAWLIFTNYATDGEIIIIHKLNERLVIRPGDVLIRLTTGEIRVQGR